MKNTVTWEEGTEEELNMAAYLVDRPHLKSRGFDNHFCFGYPGSRDTNVLSYPEQRENLPLLP